MRGNGRVTCRASRVLRPVARAGRGAGTARGLGGVGRRPAAVADACARSRARAAHSRTLRRASRWKRRRRPDAADAEAPSCASPTAARVKTGPIVSFEAPESADTFGSGARIVPAASLIFHEGFQRVGWTNYARRTRLRPAPSTRRACGDEAGLGRARSAGVRRRGGERSDGRRGGEELQELPSMHKRYPLGVAKSRATANRNVWVMGRPKVSASLYKANSGSTAITTAWPASSRPPTPPVCERRGCGL